MSTSDRVQMASIDDIVTVFVRTESETENPRAAACAARMILSNLIMVQVELEQILEDHDRTHELRPMPAVNVVTSYVTLDVAEIVDRAQMEVVVSRLPSMRNSMHDIADRWTNTANNMAELNAMTLDLGL
ncbi:MAG: hypothetical protein E6R04_11000 [Spirochaetes bacterium]|nr:MAG: hypothetical protein E6R04_11000 [Spirochaetota bacterium]